jgi:hypothetical protein
VICSELGPSICNDDESDVDSEDDAAQEQSAMRVTINELLDYMTLKLTPGEKKQIENDMLNSGLLSWWRSRTAAFAIMDRAAHCVLAYPTASARASATSATLAIPFTHKRNELSPNTVDTLLFMRSNIAK